MRCKVITQVPAKSAYTLRVGLSPVWVSDTRNLQHVVRKENSDLDLDEDCTCQRGISIKLFVKLWMY